MRRQWDEVWRFETANLAVIAEVTPEDMDPADSFQFQEDIDAVRNGSVEWFQARVRVMHKLGEDESDWMELGADYLGGCAYSKPEDLFRHHAGIVAELKTLQRAAKVRRLSRSEQRMRKGLRETLANNVKLSPPVTYCEYGPDMVRVACSAARDTLRKFKGLRLRA